MVKLLSPKDGAAVQGVVPIELEVADDEEGVTFTLSVNEEPLETLTGPPWEAEWDASAVIGGNYVIEAMATDADGLIATAKVTVFLLGSCNDLGDCPPYNVKIINPVANAVVCGLVTLEAIAEDDHGVVEMELLVDDESLGVDIDAPYQRDWDTLATGDGPQELIAVAHDTAGQSTFQSIPVSVANFEEGCDNFPSVAIDSPAPGTHVHGDVPIEVSASDDKGVVKVQLFIDDKLITEDSSFPYKHTWASDEVDEGTYSVKAVAIDTAGQSSHVQIKVTVDRTSPSVAITMPEEGAVVGDSFELAATTSDSGLATVALLAEGLPAVELSAAPFDTTVDASSLPSGALVLTATATDKAGNAASDTRSVLLDRPPTITIQAPGSGETLSGVVALAVEATDDLRIDWIQWTVNGEVLAGSPVAGETSWTDEASLDTAVLSFGPHTLGAEVTDSVGQTATAEVAVVVDQPLAVTISACDPSGACAEASEEVAGVLTLETSASDDNGQVTSVVFAPGETVLGTAAESPWEQALDTATLPDGPVTLTATAKSSLGIEAPAGLEVVVNNCDRDHDGAKAPACGGADCDDLDPKRYPGAKDTEGDGKDQDCDGTDGVDADGDGHASEASGGADCVDTDASAYPGAQDTTANGTDKDCDGGLGSGEQI